MFWVTLGKCLCNPTIIAIILAMVIGLSPAKKLFVAEQGDTAYLGSLFDAIQSMAASQVPVSMLLLSGSGTIRLLEILQEDTESLEQEEGGTAVVPPKRGAFSTTAKLLIVFGRILIMPIVGYAWWELATLTDASWSNDGHFALVVLMEA